MVALVPVLNVERQGLVLVLLLPIAVRSPSRGPPIRCHSGWLTVVFGLGATARAVETSIEAVRIICTYPDGASGLRCPLLRG